ncbi:MULTISPECIES: DUF4352 domain-containing protein [Anaerofustis]|uniref:DUF4352 domain-containing protein n=1 Tax=Anaerofustis TaxID=264995 RepID=UPI001105B637|nr:MULTISPECIES: DUF4352 domain-containing protein [Anaerofustis]MCO8194433.1 hypothetical protein [Anaerofustis sp. NSJ-163]
MKMSKKEEKRLKEEIAQEQAKLGIPPKKKSKGKKIAIIVGVIVVVLLLLAMCGGGGNTDSTPITNEEITELYTDPSSFTGRTFTFTGQVLSVEQDGNVYGIQAWYDVKNLDKNTLIYYYASEDENFSIKENDFIKATGTINGTFTGTNLLGGTVELPEMDADKVEIVSYEEVVSPANKTIELDKTSKKGNASFTIEKIELADDETRVYATLKNNGSSSISFYSYDAKLIQGGEQISTQDDFYVEGYPEIEYDLNSKAKSSGIITFPKIDKDKNFTLKFPFYDNEDFNEYTFSFDIKVK